MKKPKTISPIEIENMCALDALDMSQSIFDDLDAVLQLISFTFGLNFHDVRVN